MMKTLYKPIVALGLTGLFVMGATLGCEEEYEPLPPADPVPPGENLPADSTTDAIAPDPQGDVQPGSTPGQESYELPSTTPEN